MILDGLLVLCGTVSSDDQLAGQLVTSVGNTLATNVIDIAPAVRGGNQPPDMGQGNMANIAISIMQTLTSGGAATVQFQLVQADDAAISTNVEVLGSTPSYGFALLTAGRVVTLPWEAAEPLTPRRYVTMRVVVGTAALTNSNGQFFSYIPQAIVGTLSRYFKSGYSIT